MAVFTYLTCLKKLYKKIHFKEYCLVEQSLCELETEETKMGSNPIIMKTVDI